MSPRFRNLLLNLVLAAAAVAVMCGMAEIAARVWAAQARGAQAPVAGNRPISRYHPLLGWDKPPGGRMRITREEYDVEIAINSKGLRGPERDYPKPPGTRRVLILGDSFAEGYYVKEEDSARAVLERLLDGPGACAPYEVLNGATAGYSTDQEYLFFTEEGRRYDPDLVLVFLYYNDLYYNTTGVGTGGKPKPYFVEKDGVPVLRNTPVPEEPEGTRGAAGPLRPWHGSMALRLLSNRTVDAAPRLHALLARAGLVEPVSREPFKEFWPYSPAHPAEVEDMWRRTAVILRALDEAVRRQGGRLAILYVPSRLEVNEESLVLTDERYHLGLRRNPERIPKRLRAMCEAMSIPLLDPREALRAKESAGVRAYFPQDGHWNELGNAVVAEELAPFVRQLLPCPQSRAK
jgi:hypothetical protein